MKKFLSLVLALVMTMSLVTISAGATEFKDLTDVDSIEHKEAVELFNKIGIITGYEDGSFGPEKTITREQAAKIIAIMALGNDAASKLGVEKAPFPDVPATSQFAGYIGYCVSTGIIDGYKDGTFKPKGTLTGYQFAKMLLGVLGYGVKDEYVGSNWALNVARDGASIGLFDNATVTAGLINRDNATQIAFNALNAQLVAWSDLLGAYTALNPFTQTLLGTLAENIFDLQEVGKTDGYGYRVHAWRQSGKIITDYYMSDKVLGTENTDITYGNLYKNYTWNGFVSGSSKVNETGVELWFNGTQYYVDGSGNLTSTATGNTNIKADSFLKNSTTKNQKGWTVTLVDVKETVNNVTRFDGDVEKIIITAPALAEVTAVKAATASTDRSITLKVYDPKNTGTITVPGVETEEFAKGDYILVTPSSDSSAGYKEPLNMVKAQTVEGTVSAYYNNTSGNNGSVTVDGTKYGYNWIFQDSYALGTSLASSGYLLNKSIYTFFLDDAGYVIGAKVKEDAINDYAYIIAVGEDSFQNNNIVKVLTSDGKIGTYTVSSKSYADAYDDGTRSDAYAEESEIYAYSINSNNEIVLEDVNNINSTYDQVLYAKGATTPSATAGTITKFDKGYSVMTMTNGLNSKNVVYATDSTVFMYYDAANNTVTTYVGKSNAPSISSAKNASVIYSDVTEDGKTVSYATYVVITSAPENTMTDNYVYVLNNNPYGQTQDVNGDKIYLYKVVKDGAVVNIAVDKTGLSEGVYLYGFDEAKYAGDTANSVEAGVYSLTAAKPGSVGNGTTGDYKANVVIGVSSNDNVIVTPDNKDQFVISPDTEITDITNQSDIITDASFEVGDTIVVVYKVTSGLQIADAIYITGIHIVLSAVDPQLHAVAIDAAGAGEIIPAVVLVYIAIGDVGVLSAQHLVAHVVAGDDLAALSPGVGVVAIAIHLVDFLQIEDVLGQGAQQGLVAHIVGIGSISAQQVRPSNQIGVQGIEGNLGGVVTVDQAGGDSGVVKQADGSAVTSHVQSPVGAHILILDTIAQHAQQHLGELIAGQSALGLEGAILVAVNDAGGHAVADVAGELAGSGDIGEGGLLHAQLGSGIVAQGHDRDDLGGLLTGDGLFGAERAILVTGNDTDLVEELNGLFVLDAVHIGEVLELGGTSADGDQRHGHDQSQHQRKELLHGIPP